MVNVFERVQGDFTRTPSFKLLEEVAERFAVDQIDRDPTPSPGRLSLRAGSECSGGHDDAAVAAPGKRAAELTNRSRLPTEPLIPLALECRMRNEIKPDGRYDADAIDAAVAASACDFNIVEPCTERSKCSG